MNIKEALQAGIKYETKVRDAYRSAMETAIDERTRLLFQGIAKEEHGHLEYLRKAYTNLVNKGKLDRFDSELEKIWPEAEESLERIEDTLGMGKNKERSIRVLQEILEVERETYNFYLKVSSELPGNHKTFFERFVKSEKHHLEKIQNRLKTVSNGVSYTP